LGGKKKKVTESFKVDYEEKKKKSILDIYLHLEVLL